MIERGTKGIETIVRFVMLNTAPTLVEFVVVGAIFITLFGVVLTLCGWQVMRVAWFPIVFLVCMIPWPGLVYSAIALPLQNLAANVAVAVLQICGVDASQFGTKIFMERGLGQPPRTLNVAEACAGMRSLMTFISVGAAVAFISNRPLWQKLVITLYYHEELTMKEVGAVLGLTESRVSQLHSQAMLRLKGPLSVHFRAPRPDEE